MKTGFVTFLTLAAVACQGAAEALAAEDNNGGAGAAGAPAGDPPKRRGRPPGGGTPATGAPAGDTAPTNTEQFEKNRALIKPLIDPPSNLGEEVKKVIAKYSKTGLKDIPAASQEAFEKDIDALAY